MTGDPVTLRIHFTADDLARTTLAAGPDIMWELVCSLHRLQSARTSGRYGPWLRHARARLARPAVREALRLLTLLVPRRGNFPDFLTPPAQGDFAAAVDLVRGTPDQRLRRELAAVFRDRRVPSWVRRLADGDRSCRRELQTSLAVHYREVLRPCLPELGETVLAERAWCGRGVLDGGVELLLGTLAPSIRWSAPVLSADYPGGDRDLHLRGRGITLIPSFFCTDTPVTLIDPELPPVLVYPVTGRSRPAPPPDGLAALLGRTRALAIHALSDPRSTTELALCLGVSIGTASRHAAALRDAGLVTSTRHGSAMLHVATDLGRRLVRSH